MPGHAGGDRCEVDIRGRHRGHGLGFRRLEPVEQRRRCVYRGPVVDDLVAATAAMQARRQDEVAVFAAHVDVADRIDAAARAAADFSRTNRGPNVVELPATPEVARWPAGLFAPPAGFEPATHGLGNRRSIP